MQTASLQTGQWIYMGKAVAPHGLDGSFVVELINDRSSLWKKNLAIKLISENSPDSMAIESEIIDVKGKVQKKIILRVSSHATLDLIKTILPIQIWVNRSSFPSIDKDEIYLQDLVGLDVFDTEGKFISKVKGIAENKSQNLIILNDKDETMIPYVPAWIHSIDFIEQKIMINPILDFS